MEDDPAAICDQYEQFDPALVPRFEARLEEEVERIEMFTGLMLESYRRVLLKWSRTWPCISFGANRIDVLAVVARSTRPCLDRDDGVGQGR